MSSLNEIAFNIIDLLRDRKSDYNVDQIKYNIKYYRNLFIRRDLRKYGVRQEPFEQEISPVQVEQVSNARYSAGDSDVLRSSEQIPNLLRLKNRQALTYAGPTDNSDSYPVIQYHEARHQSYNKWTSNKTRVFTENRYIYVIGGLADNLHKSSNKKTNIVTRGIFEDPEDVIEYNTGSSYNHNNEFPSLPEDYIQRITQGLASGELQIKAQGQQQQIQE